VRGGCEITEGAVYSGECLLRCRIGPEFLYLCIDPVFLRSRHHRGLLIVYIVGNRLRFSLA
jgi:hypothetical protein